MTTLTFDEMCLVELDDAEMSGIDGGGDGFWAMVGGAALGWAIGKILDFVVDEATLLINGPFNPDWD